MTLDVIGAGFGRTGTDSMREALNITGGLIALYLSRRHMHRRQPGDLVAAELRRRTFVEGQDFLAAA